MVVFVFSERRYIMNALKIICEISSQVKFINDLKLVYYGYKNPIQVWLETITNYAVKECIFGK